MWHTNYIDVTDSLYQCDSLYIYVCDSLYKYDSYIDVTIYIDMTVYIDVTDSLYWCDRPIILMWQTVYINVTVFVKLLYDLSLKSKFYK